MMGTPTSDRSNEQLNEKEKELAAKLVNGDALDDKDIVIPSSKGHLVGSVQVDESEEWKGKNLNLGSKFRILKRTDQIWEFQTVIRGIIQMFAYVF